MRSHAVIAPVVALLSACVENPEDLPPLPNPASGSFLAVASSDFQSGALHTIDLSTLSVRKNIDVVDAQPVVRAFGQQIFVLDQTHGALRIYDVARDFATPSDYPIGHATVPAGQANPYDLYVDAPRNVLYVTLYGSYGSTVITGAKALAMIDLRNPSAGIVRFIPLPVAGNDPDGNPDATRLVGCGDTLHVLLQDVDRTANYVPAGPGRLAMVNLTDLSDIRIVPLGGENPTALAIMPGCTEAIVGSSGDQLSATLSGKSGIERVDLVERKTLGLVLTDINFGGNVTTLDAVSVHDVFVAISSRSGTVYSNDVYVVDAAAAIRSQKLLGPMNFVPQLRVIAGQLVVLSAGTPQAGQLKTGLYIGPASGAPLPSDSTIDLGLPPISADLFMFAFTR